MCRHLAVDAGSRCPESYGSTFPSMKGLLVSDIHYRLKQLDWLASVAPEFDLVVIAGDHLDVASAGTIEAQVAGTLKYLERVASATRLGVWSGDYDLNARRAESGKGGQRM